MTDEPKMAARDRLRDALRPFIEGLGHDPTEHPERAASCRWCLALAALAQTEAK